MFFRLFFRLSAHFSTPLKSNISSKYPTYFFVARYQHMINDDLSKKKKSPHFWEKCLVLSYLKLRSIDSYLLVLGFFFFFEKERREEENEKGKKLRKAIKGCQHGKPFSGVFVRDEQNGTLSTHRREPNTLARYIMEEDGSVVHLANEFDSQLRNGEVSACFKSNKNSGTGIEEIIVRFFSKFVQMLTKARFTLSGCESERYKVGYDPIHIRFGSASDPLHFSTKVCVYTEWIDNFVSTRAPWSLARRSCFSVISQPSKSFVSNFLLSSDNAIRSNVFGMPSLFSKAISH